MIIADGNEGNHRGSFKYVLWLNTESGVQNAVLAPAGSVVSRTLYCEGFSHINVLVTRTNGAVPIEIEYRHVLPSFPATVSRFRAVDTWLADATDTLGVFYLGIQRSLSAGAGSNNTDFRFGRIVQFRFTNAGAVNVTVNVLFEMMG